MTFKDLQAKYEGTITHYSEYRKWASALSRISEFFRNRHPNDVFTIDVAAYREWRLTHVKPGTVNVDIDAGRSFYNWMEAQEIVDHNPFRGMQLKR